MVAFTMLRVSVLSLTLLAGQVLASPTSPSLLTPHGIRPSANFHAVPEGGNVILVDSEIHLVDASGTVVHVAANDHSEVKAAPTTPKAHPLANDDGWIAYADWYNTGRSPINVFTTTWTVPPVPKKDNGQTLFLFNALEPASGNAILQPVLQYGPSAAGGGSYWSVASWYIVGSQVYYTNPVQVNPGQTLTGQIALFSTSTRNSRTTYSYAATFSGIRGTSILATGSDQLVWATETLEAYGANKIKNYPTGSTVFRNIVIRTQAGTPNVFWSTESDEEDGITATVNQQGATNARITIDY